MASILKAMNQQIEDSIYSQQTPEAKKIAWISTSEKIKKSMAISAIAAPIFAFFLPHFFGFITCLAFGFSAYNVFTIANNFSNAANNAVQGNVPSGRESHVERLFKNTVFERFV